VDLQEVLILGFSQKILDISQKILNVLVVGVIVDWALQ
jgi:hypothetical protein